MTQLCVLPAGTDSFRFGAENWKECPLVTTRRFGLNLLPWQSPPSLDDAQCTPATASSSDGGGSAAAAGGGATGLGVGTLLSCDAILMCDGARGSAAGEPRERKRSEEKRREAKRSEERRIGAKRRDAIRSEAKRSESKRSEAKQSKAKHNKAKQTSNDRGRGVLKGGVGDFS